MTHEFLFTALVVVLFNRAEIGIQRGFDIDHDLAAIGHADDHVRALPAFVGAHAFLFVEVAVFHHAGQFGQPLEGHLAPLAANLGAAQGVDQIAGFVAQVGLRAGHVFQMAVQGAIGLAALLFHAPDLLLGFFQRIADGLDQVLDGLFLLRQFRLRL